MADLEADVLAAIVPKRIDRMAYVRIRLSNKHFYDDNHVEIYKRLVKYYERYGDLPAAGLFNSWIQRSLPDELNSATALIILERVFAQLEAREVTESVFRFAVDQLVDRHSKYYTGKALNTAWEILDLGLEPDDQPGVVLKGHQAAREYAYAKLSEIDRAEYGEHAPGGDMRHEVKLAMSDYASRKERDQTGAHTGILSGIACVDRTTGGLQAGELGLVVGYTTAGKSQLCTNWAWNAAVEQRHAVVFFTTETVRDQVKRRLYARHSRLPQFGRPGGLNSKDIRNGTLTPADEEVFRAVVDDLDRNLTYGGIHLAQVPSQAPLSYVEARLREAGRQYDVKLCVVDYLALIRSDQKRRVQLEEYNDVLRGAKQMATSFNNGEGVPVVSPWQVQQSAYREAIKHRAYTLTSLSETSEAEKVSDTIMAILREEDETRTARLQFLKIRDGDIPPIQEVEIDFRCSYWGDRSTFTPGQSGPQSEIEEFLSG